ncbi:CBN-FARS-2 protein [Caenorhabditis brenneri]|uniref:CBN-FARS-2 protein n=1 Tax=Caenorhabditis brenneri TaxID=135651 RepID=G0N1K6_CAEBE|nr:CBN-FARS-2 protein [Caenorhabditis brenneri]
MVRGTKRRRSPVEKPKAVALNRDDTILVDEDDVAVGDSQCPSTKSYARLVGIRRGVATIDLTDDNFVCGRGSEDATVNYNFSALVHDAGLYRFISKIQFAINRDADTRRVYLHDHSRNGTLVNQEMLGKGQSRELNNGDLISIGIPALIIFVYETADDNQYPEELVRKYHVTTHSLGKGGFGKVLLGYKRSDRSVVAIKCLNTQYSTRCSRAIAKARDIRNEVEVMKKLSHPNIVAIYDWITVSKYSYMVIEYVGGGEFFSKVVDSKYQRMGLGESLGKYFAYQLIDAVMYLHSVGICHRDIKPENILCTDKSERCILKLTDFGMAKTTAMSKMKTRCGTPSYNAPEIVANEGVEYTPKVDIWSLGCVLFITFSGYPPFSEEYTDMSMENQVMKGRLVFHSQWRHITLETQNMIKWMLTVEPTNRPSAVELMSTEWMKCADCRTAKQDIAKSLAKPVARFCATTTKMISFP